MLQGRMRGISFALVFLSTALLVPLLAQAPGFGESFKLPDGALVAPGKAADLTLLYTGDVLGYVDPCG